jgi:hypothetical protein
MRFPLFNSVSVESVRKVSRLSGRGHFKNGTCRESQTRVGICHRSIVEANTCNLVHGMRRRREILARGLPGLLFSNAVLGSVASPLQHCSIAAIQLRIHQPLLHCCIAVIPGNSNTNGL